MSIVDRWKSWSPQFLALLRIAASLMFINFGTMKLFGWPNAMPPGNEATMFSQIWLAGILETFGGALMLIGLFARPVAFVLSGMMAVAYFQGHFPMGFFPSQNNGTGAALYCFVWLYFSSVGAGVWSVDGLREKKK